MAVDHDAFAQMDATEQAMLVRRGDVSALELVDAAIRRIEKLEPRINALVSENFALARERARNTSRDGVFAGVPTLIKDLTAYPGHAAGFGTRMFHGQVSPAGSQYTEALDAAGLIVLGKSATSEFGLLGTTETLVNGATRNPWNLSLSPGGSSGGAVAAVASGMVPVAHASDGGGSIRGPASFAGLFGFKPSRGRTVLSGIPAEMPTARLISDHCVSRSVRDSANWLLATEQPGVNAPLPTATALAGTAPKRLRIGAYRNDCFGRPPSKDALCAFETAMRLCEQLGHDVVEIAGPAIDAEATGKAFFALSGIAIGGILEHVKQVMGQAYDPSLLEPYTSEIVRRAQTLSPADWPEMMGAFAAAEIAADRAMSGYDVLLSPTVPFGPCPLGMHGPNEDADAANAFTQQLAGYTVVASLAGWPAMSVPLYWTAEGLPIGCHFAAARDEDALLFSLAFQLEMAAPWRHRLADLTETLLCLND
ncbi:amidase [Rhizobium sp. KVB221]|uniref:Amidase n=1 Tax=Rhizobium setariae TaxID=2801340 RepID=A0A937CKV1_9HYPH|nr:amidase [Rhizobium setariae]